MNKLWVRLSEHCREDWKFIHSMGRLFLDHWGGRRIFVCEKCGVYLSNRTEVESTTSKGYTGRAFLFRRVANITEGKAKEQDMVTGKHIIRDVNCRNCNTKLGWMYEFAMNVKEQYKEGMVILERKFIKEKEVFNKKLAELVPRPDALLEKKLT